MRRAWRFLWRTAAICAGGLAALLLLVSFLPMKRPPLTHQTPSVLSYEETVKELRRSIESEPDGVRAKCRAQLLDHGRPTERVFVLLHGLSNCPAQFFAFGQMLHERGSNVLIPRLPGHGKEDRMTTEWGRLDAAEMLRSGNRAVDLARSLGGKVTVVGLSVNGTVTAWMAQNRSDVDCAVTLAPFFAPAGMPDWAFLPVERLLLRLPNMFFWWNPALKEANPGPPYAYPRFPTRVIGETMYLGREVLRESRTQPAQAGSILIVTTAADNAINNSVIARLGAQWKRLRPDIVSTYQFPEKEQVPHDFIDPTQPNQKTELVYPRLLELIDKKPGN